MAKASELIKLAQSWIGKNEADSTHKSIIDIYNGHQPLARGYRVKYTDSWCATFISALAISCKATDIIPTECGCGEMIALCQDRGIWVEDESRVPNGGDIIFYDWNDSGLKDNKGWPDHVGIVEKVEGNTITVIEGNYNNAVSRRNVAVNGKYIRGYVVPRYEPESVETPKQATVTIRLEMLRKGSKGKQVGTLQSLLIVKGYSCGKYGIDEDFGADTESAVKKYQREHELEVDGIVGKDTWTSLLK